MIFQLRVTSAHLNIIVLCSNLFVLVPGTKKTSSSGPDPKTLTSTFLVLEHSEFKREKRIKIQKYNFGYMEMLVANLGASSLKNSLILALVS